VFSANGKKHGKILSKFVIKFSTPLTACYFAFTGAFSIILFFKAVLVLSREHLWFFAALESACPPTPRHTITRFKSCLFRLPGYEFLQATTHEWCPAVATTSGSGEYDPVSSARARLLCRRNSDWRRSATSLLLPWERVRKFVLTETWVHRRASRCLILNTNGGSLWK